MSGVRYKTTKNFMLVLDILQDVKHYSRGESERIARQIFKDAKASNKTVDSILAYIPTKEEMWERGWTEW